MEPPSPAAPSFNLTVEPWIGAVDTQMQTETYSLIELFRQAPNLREITDPNPLTVGASMRLLLTILHRAINGPQHLAQWVEIWNSGSFDACGVLEYLNAQQQQFDLFSETVPFYQTANFTLENTASSHKLTHDLASGNNKTLFDHSLDTQPLPMTPAQAARGLITIQLYGFGGGQGATSNLFTKPHPYLANSPLIGSALVFLRGDNLFQTLLLNLLLYDADRVPIACIGEDRPIWERDDLPTPGIKPVAGYLEYLTWRSRHIRLLPEQNGDQTVVRHLYIAQAEIFPTDFRSREQDPMFAYQEARDGSLKPLRLQKDRAFWRDSASLFEYGSDEKQGGRHRPRAFFQLAELMRQNKIREQRFFRCFIIGLVNDKANPLLWRMEEMNVPTSLLEDRHQVRILKEALHQAESVGECLQHCTRVLAEALLTVNKRSPDQKDVAGVEQTLQVLVDYWAALEAPFFTLLQEPSEERQRQWSEILFSTAREVLERNATQYVATSARDLQAQVKGLRCLRNGLKKLHDEYFPEAEKAEKAEKAEEKEKEIAP